MKDRTLDTLVYIALIVATIMFWSGVVWMLTTKS